MILCPDEPHNHLPGELDETVKAFKALVMRSSLIHATGSGMSIAAFDQLIHNAKEGATKLDDLIDEISYTWEIESKGARGEDVPARRALVAKQIRTTIDIVKILTHELEFKVDRGV
ncbi:MAG TPA: hypothetical protein VGS11_10865 [Candidatus Bathyarchaeia archaeon]|nr:hypothetical protein [Candidatus Bathyarchaeia archaeon]